MLNKAKKGTHCIFCPRTNLSREHVWADWLKQYIPKNASYHSSLSATAHPTYTEFKRRKISGDIQSRKLRIVGELCNNEWMSQLQDRAKPYMLHKRDREHREHDRLAVGPGQS